MDSTIKKAHWPNYILNRIKRNKNFIGFVGGPTGSGKSWTCLRIAEEIDPNFSMEQCVFSPMELMNLLNSGQLRTGSVIIFEEAGVALSNRNWQGVVNKVINYLFQTFRHKRYILLLNSPYMDFVDKATRKLIHAELQVESISLTHQKTIVKPMLLQYNGRKDKFYYKYLRVQTEEGMGKVQRWAVKKPSKKLRESYEIKKVSYTKGLNEDIMKQLLAKEDKEKPKQEVECDECGYSWVPRGSKPGRCPKCQKFSTHKKKDPISS